MAKKPTLKLPINPFMRAVQSTQKSLSPKGAPPKPVAPPRQPVRLPTPPRTLPVRPAQSRPAMRPIAPRPIPAQMPIAVNAPVSPLSTQAEVHPQAAIPGAKSMPEIIQAPTSYKNGTYDEITEFYHDDDDGYGEQHYSLEQEINDQIAMEEDIQAAEASDETAPDDHAFDYDPFYNNISDPKYIAGFSLKPPKALRKLASKATKTFKSATDGLKKVAEVAKIMGPIAADLVPGVGPALEAAGKLQKMAEAGDKLAQGQIAKIVKDAASNVPQAKEALAALDAVKNIDRNVAATGLLEAAKAGDPEAKAKIAALKTSTDPDARKAAAALDSAATGILQEKAASGPKYLRGTIEMHWVPEAVAKLD